MKVLAFIIGGLILIGVILEFIGKIVADNEKNRFKKMTPDERFNYQNNMRKKEL